MSSANDLSNREWTLCREWDQDNNDNCKTLLDICYSKHLAIELFSAIMFKAVEAIFCDILHIMFFSRHCYKISKNIDNKTFGKFNKKRAKPEKACQTYT